MLLRNNLGLFQFDSFERGTTWISGNSQIGRFLNHLITNLERQLCLGSTDQERPELYGHSVFVSISTYEIRFHPTWD